VNVTVLKMIDMMPRFFHDSGFNEKCFEAEHLPPSDERGADVTPSAVGNGVRSGLHSVGVPVFWAVTVANILLSVCREVIGLFSLVFGTDCSRYVCVCVCVCVCVSPARQLVT
jgi:hypothetical protein